MKEILCSGCGALVSAGPARGLCYRVQRGRVGDAFEPEYDEAYYCPECYHAVVRAAALPAPLINEIRRLLAKVGLLP